jgi:hypothetical protein
MRGNLVTQHPNIITHAIEEDNSEFPAYADFDIGKCPNENLERQL